MMVNGHLKVMFPILFPCKKYVLTSALGPERRLAAEAELAHRVQRCSARWPRDPRDPRDPMGFLGVSSNLETVAMHRCRAFKGCFWIIDVHRFSLLLTQALVRGNASAGWYDEVDKQFFGQQFQTRTLRHCSNADAAFQHCPSMPICSLASTGHPSTLSFAWMSIPLFRLIIAYTCNYTQYNTS